MTDLTGGSGMSRDLRELSEDASPGPWSVGPEGFGIVPADPHENTRLGADSRYIVALVNWHRAALLADTPSVEPLDVEQLARALEGDEPLTLMEDRDEAPEQFSEEWFRELAVAIAAEYARLLPTRASDSPEKP